MRRPPRQHITALTASAACLALAACTAPGPDDCGTPQLSGTFIQPTPLDYWTITEWNTELGYLAEAQITDIALQWSSDSGWMTTTYPTELSGFTHTTSDEREEDFVGNALTAADEHGIDVYVGLQRNEEWWERYSSDAEWLSEQAEVSNALADELWENYGHHESFAGWYLEFEVDNWHHTTRDHWTNLTAYYSEVTEHLHQLSGDLPVVIAPFFTPEAELGPEEWTEMWAFILPDSGIDVIALQDGVGVGNLELDEVGQWFRATVDAIEQAGTGTALWADTETMDENLDPVGVEQFQPQMCAVEPYVDRFWSYSYTHYQSPQQGAEQYHQEYLHYLETGELP